MKQSAIIIIAIVTILIIGCKADPSDPTSTEPTKIKGNVTDSFNAPLSGVKIITVPATSEVYTDASGNFIIENISTGTYQILSSKEGYQSKTSNLQVNEHETKSITIKLTELSNMKGMVVELSTGLPMSGVYVTSGFQGLDDTTDSEGRFAFNKIPVNDYNCYFILSGYSIQRRIVNVVPGYTADLTVEMVPLSELSLVYVEGGTFAMGDSFGDGFYSERPVHDITVNSFMIGKFEVYQKEWIETIGNNPAKFWGDTLPVESISWNDAIEFCNTRSTLENLTPCYSFQGNEIICDFNANGYRLPTEAEWEYASRGGNLNSGSRYSGGNGPDSVAWYYNNSGNITHEVGVRTPNQLLIHDMSGNVWEYCWDYYDEYYYPTSPSNNPTGPIAGAYKTARGGSWTDAPPMLTNSYRNYYRINERGSNVGMRVVRKSN